MTNQKADLLDRPIQRTQLAVHLIVFKPTDYRDPEGSLTRQIQPRADQQVEPTELFRQ